jgi:hypothetical protein
VIAEEISIVDTEGAPIVFFDGVEAWATTVGDIGHLTLTAFRQVIEKMELVAAKPAGRS